MTVQGYATVQREGAGKFSVTFSPEDCTEVVVDRTLFENMLEEIQDYRVQANDIYCVGRSV